MSFELLTEVGDYARKLAGELDYRQRHCQGHSFLTEALCRSLGIEAQVFASALPYHFFCVAEIGLSPVVLDAFPEGARMKSGVVVRPLYGEAAWSPYGNGDRLSRNGEETGSLMFEEETWAPLRAEAERVVQAYPEIIAALKAKSCFFRA